MTQSYKSHAKINLFLRIIGKRQDGYHNIQSIFQLIDLYDEIIIKKRKDSLIKIKCNVKEIENNNLINKSIDYFLDYTKAPKIGLDIILKMGQVKNLKPNSTQKNIKTYVILKATQMGSKF